MTDKLKKICFKNHYNLIISVFIIVFFIINLYDLKYKLKDTINNTKYYIFFSVISIFLYIIFLFLNKITSKKIENKIQRVFLIVALVFGSIFLVLSPLFTGSDEHNHYYRIYEITDGVLVTPTDKLVGSQMPESLQNTFEIASGNNTKIKYRDIKKMKKIKLKKDSTKQYGDLWTNSYNNTALYSPIQYLPQVIGFMIGKIFNLGPLFIGILGRIFNLIFYVLIGYFCLKILPKSKLFYFFILISPNMLQCATTLSADAFTNGIFLLIISIFLNFYDRENIIKRSEEMLLFVLCVFISLCKIVYLPIVLLLLIINKNKFEKGKKEKIIFNAITIFCSIVVSLLWIKCTKGVFAIEYDKAELQKQFIIHNLFEYALILIRTFSFNIVKYVECLFVGTTMYHSQLEMPILISFIYIAIVLISLIKEKDENKFKIIHKTLVVSIGIAIIGLISTAIYIQCTAQYISVGNNIIQGIQGRYFIPVIFLIPFIIKPMNRKINIDEKIMYKSVLSINIITFFYMINQFIK